MYNSIFTILLALTGFPFDGELDSNMDHAIYLSLVEVDHKKLGNTAVMKIKVFADDMQDAIVNASGKRIDFLNSNNCEISKAEVEFYFAKHFEYRIDGKPTPLTLFNCEPTGDAIWFHFKIDCPSRWTKVAVKADFLMELFPTQSNIITIYHGEVKRFLKITNTHPEEVVTF